MNSVPTLDAILKEPTCATELPRKALGELLAQAAAVQSALAAQLIAKGGEAEQNRSAQQPERPSETAERLLTAGEVAEMLGFAKSYVYELLRRGDLPAVRHKKYVRVRRSAVLAFIAQHEMQSSSALTSLSMMLNKSHDRRRDEKQPTGARIGADPTRRTPRRALDDGQSMGARNGADS